MVLRPTLFAFLLTMGGCHSDEHVTCTACSTDDPTLCADFTHGSGDEAGARRAASVKLCGKLREADVPETQRAACKEYQAKASRAAAHAEPMPEVPDTVVSVSCTHKTVSHGPSCVAF